MFDVIRAWYLPLITEAGHSFDILTEQNSYKWQANISCIKSEINKYVANWQEIFYPVAPVDLHAYFYYVSE